MNNHRTGIAAAFLLVLLLGGCETAPPLEPVAIPPADTEFFAGRVLCLDPGHGGTDPGAVGRYGLREADANLQVAVALRAMLESAGARVLLTRDRDRALSLDERVQFNRRHRPDVFLSLHHNSSGDPFFNRTEMYYHYSEAGGPSEDLAGDMLREFERLYNFTRSRALIASAYGVLRNNEGTAILGEPSYLSDPVMEKRLRTPEGIRDEAHAYYRSLRTFFAKGTPIIALDPIPENPERIRVVLTDARSAIDPSSIQVLLGESPLDFTCDSATGELWTAALDDLPGGSHTVRIHAANLNGRRARWTEQTFRVNRRAERLHVAVELPAGRGPARVAVRVTDARGRAVADDTPLGLSSSSAVIFAETRTFGGVGYFYLSEVPRDALTITAGPLRHTLHVADATGPRLRTARIVDARTGRPVPGAVAEASGGNPFQADRNGWLGLPESETGALTLRAPGHNPVVMASGGLSAAAPIPMRPRLSGALAGKRIFLDPEAGGDETGVVTAARHRASDLNLAVAQYLREALEWAGAEAILAREDDRTLDMPTRARMSLDANPDLYLAIFHTVRRGSEASGANRTRVLHRWQTPLPMARAMAPVVSSYLGTDGHEVNHHVTQALMHSQESFLSLAVGPAYLSAPALQEAAALPSTARREAVAILYGLVEAFSAASDVNPAPPEPDRLRLVAHVVNAETAASLPEALVTLDGGLHLQTSASGVAEFRYLSPGEHVLRVIAPGYLPWEGRVDVTGEIEGVTITLTAR